MGKSQLCVAKLAERKSFDLKLQAQLLKGVVFFYTSAYNISTAELKKVISNETRVFLNNRRMFYLGESYKKMTEAADADFDEKGTGFGKAIAYLRLAAQSYRAGTKELVFK
jgi:hypothetical protein